jgi:nucleotide-binding universal stress UspA family protein
MSSQLDGAIVVGVAESVFRGGALTWAAQQARLEKRPLTLVNASGPVSAAWAENGMDAAPRSSSVLRRHGEDLLGRAQAVVEAAAPEVEVGRVFAVANPATLLLQSAATAHLMVLGSRGRGPVRSHVLGSVGLAVVRHAHCPVVVHRPGDHPGRVHRGVLVAAEATEDSVPVLEFAFSLAGLRRLPLHVVHYVYDVRSTLVGVAMVGELADETAEHERRLAESMAGLRQQFPDVFVTVETKRGLPEQELVDPELRADLLVVGNHQRGLLGRALAGSVSTSVVERAHGAVAVVPQGRDRDA